ncbi:MAG: hypothetical protein H7A24_09715 [Leptospiraceae bacterium]|nr:hypothetical protein [Leptospiraceae bacterium]MCP5512148.1 hypothetical protein [Leptospiraceae bacterium]
MDTLGLDFGINKYDSDYYLYVNPTFNLNFTDWGIGFQIPLNLLLLDKEPKMTNSSVGMLRPGDYDSKLDYQKILNYIYFGTYGIYKPEEITYSIYIGKLFDGYIGHGTIINRYVNNLTVDHYKQGVMADINTDWGGVQVFTNSVLDRKEVNSARAYVRPFGIFLAAYSLYTGGPPKLMMPGNVLDAVGRKKVGEEVDEVSIIEEKDGKLIERKEEAPRAKYDDEKPKKTGWGYDHFLNRIALGYTVAYDGAAPNQLTFDSTGTLKFDSNNDPLAASTQKISIEGYDAEFKIFNLSWFELTPYYDVNRIKFLNNAQGKHYGIHAKIGGKQLNLTVKPEFRQMDSNYIPIYFDSYYEIERFQVNLDNNFPLTKYEYVTDIQSNGSKIKGYYHTVVLNVYSIGLEGNYEDYDGEDNSRVFVGLYVPIGSMFRISGFYQKKGFNKFSQAFKMDDKAMGVGELAVNLSFVTLKVQNRRRWVFDSEFNQFKSKDETVFMASGGKSF